MACEHGFGINIIELRLFTGTMTENWDEPAPAVELPEIKLFGKWSSDDVQVSDISLTVSLELMHET